MTGVKFENCEVLKRSGTNNDNKAVWLCLCRCGEEFKRTGKQLRRGKLNSCGCIRNEKIKEVGFKNITHGQSGSRLYDIWRGVKKRCRHKNDKGYKHYGGRGINVCDDWYENYESFEKWARNNGYQENLTIDRIDVNGDYTPNNCRWVDMKTQQRNRRNNVRVNFEGQLITLSEVSERTGLSRGLITYRNKNGIKLDKPIK